MPKVPSGGLCADPAPEPHRVRRDGESVGGGGREREGSSAAGHPGGGLRQYRGRLKRVSRVPRSVRYRGAARRAARGRQSQPARFECEVLHRGQPESRRSRCLSARAAASGSNTTSRPTASIASRSTTLQWARTALPSRIESTLVIMIDGRIVFRKPIGGPEDLALADRTAGTGRAQIMERFSKIPVQVEAGVRDVVVAFIDRSHVETDEQFRKTGRLRRLDRQPGPPRPHGASSRRRRDRRAVQPQRRFENAQPGPHLRLRSQNAQEESSCARQITENLARRAFRRPVTAEDMKRLMPFYEAGRKDGGTFDQGIEQVVAAVLVSPQFLYRAHSWGRRAPRLDTRVRSHRSRTRFPAFLLPVEHRPRRGTADAGSGERVDPAWSYWKNK